MNLSLLDTLRYKISVGKVFSETFEYFFENFGEDEEFMELGEPAEDETLVQLLGHIGGMMFQTDKVRLDHLLLISIPGHNFIHGGMMLNGAMANVIYCADLQQGILAVHRPKLTPSMQFARFSAEMLTPTMRGDKPEFKH